jgi:hypothetical protein
MRSIITVATSSLGGVEYRLIYDPQFCVWSIYENDNQIDFTVNDKEAVTMFNELTASKLRFDTVPLRWS